MSLTKFGLRVVLGLRLPRTRGTIRVPGLDGPIAIRRDAYGIPYVEAQTEADGWYALGFCQGQDRAFQLESQLRVVRGTLAEWVGSSGLAIDRLSRRVGFWRAAERQLEVLDEDTRVIVEAFARGVTDGETLGCHRRAHEFVLLRSTPSRYQPTDVLAVLKLQAFLLESNWAAELCRLHVLTKDGPEALRGLDPSWPQEHGVSTEEWQRCRTTAARLAEDISATLKAMGVGGMSNNWAVAGWRTAAGRPILANDPHLSPTLPPHWYLAHVRASAWAVSGASFVGAPGFLAGHNGYAAWGVTASLADTADLFIEEVGEDGRTLREGDRFVECEVRREVIQVRGSEHHEEDVLVGPRGPVIGPAPAGENRALSLRATWLAPRSTEALCAIHRACNLDEMRSILAAGSAVGLSFVYADESGTIAWQLAGDTPRRQKGWGTLPQPGWDQRFAWLDGPIAFQSLPFQNDPASGVVASANNPPPADDAAFLGFDWVDSYRYDRIVSMLESRTDWDVSAVQRLQMDRRSLPWKDLRETVLAVPGRELDAARALALLRDWDGDVGPASAAASVFEIFLTEMMRRIAWAKAPRSAQWVLGAQVSPLLSHSIMAVRRVGHLVRILQEQPEGWMASPWSSEIEEALAFAVRSLRSKFGDDDRRWAWGRVRPLTFRHPFGERRLFGGAFNLGPIPWGGDTNTVSQASVDSFDPTTDPLYVASLRMTVDVGDWNNCLFALPGGQSGNPLSQHYDDLLPYWQRGDGVPVPWDAEDVKRRARGCLRLVPKEA